MNTNFNRNIYVINHRDMIGNIRFKERLEITNCYLVFRKFEHEKRNNLATPFNNIPERNEFKIYTDYVQLATKNIIDYIVKIYEKSSYTYNHKIIQESGNGQEKINMEQITYDQFKFLFLKTNSSLILLNYINKYENFESYFPLHIKDSNVFAYRVNYLNCNFLAVNTFEPFLNYACKKGKIANRSLNNPFFSEFQSALNNGKTYNEGNGFLRVLESNNGYNKEFRFLRFNDIIIIYDYDIYYNSVNFQ